MKLSPEQIADYLHRSYTAVDGLWFMQVEQAYGFDTALDIDEKVWRILPKIQARKLKALLRAESGIEGLYECFTAKLEIEGFLFQAEKHPAASGFTVTVRRCPWLQLLRRAGREHLAGVIADRICTAEYETWAREFGPGIRYDLHCQLCRGGATCMLQFTGEPMPSQQ